MTTRDQIIEKHDGIYRIMRKYFIATSLSDMDWGELKALESELAALKSQLEKEPEMYPEEFFVWHIEDANNYFPQRNENDELVFWDMSQNKGITLAELYTIWKDNIKNK